MKVLHNLYVIVLTAVVACSAEEIAQPPGLVAPLGSTPTIDGNFDPGEWNDALAISLDTTKTVWLKHDNQNFYLATNGHGGNIYISNDGKVFVLHASASLGWSEFSGTIPGSWTLERGYEWELHGLQEGTDDEIQEGILGYLAERGWVASLGNMGEERASEFVISFDWLNLATDTQSGEYVQLPKLMFSSHSHLPGGERAGPEFDFRWPENAVAIDSVDRGYSLESIELDTSKWGEIYIDPHN